MDRPVRKLAAGLLFDTRRRGCRKWTRRCDFWNWGEGGLRPACCTAHLLEMTFAVADVLERHGITFWLDYGTLLGAVRSGELIPWDDDVDLGILAADLPRVHALGEEIARAGFWLDLRTEGVTRVAYSHTNLQYVDLFAWHEHEGLLRTPLAGQYAWPGMAGRAAFPAAYVRDMETATLHGRRLPVPTPVHEFLRDHRYGPDYMVPQSLDLSDVPEAEAEEITPAVRAALVVLRDRRRDLQRRRAHSRLNQFDPWRRFVDEGLAQQPAPGAVQRVRRELAPGETDGERHVLDEVARSIALIERRAAELSDRRAIARARRLGRSLRRRYARRGPREG